MPEPTTDNSKQRKNTHWDIYEGFEGRFTKLFEVRHLIPRFKEFYYEKKTENPTMAAVKIINEFNKIIAPEKFFPYSNTYRGWRRHWDAELQSKISGFENALVKRPVEIVQTRDAEGNAIVPNENDLEAGAKNLAGELMNDAMSILKNDQQLEELYDDEIIVKRRNYALNVFNYVMKAVHTKMALTLKAKAEQRETAGFLMELIRGSTAGKITSDDMAFLEQSVIHSPKTNERPTLANNS